jgi:hypothetical protein
MYRKKCDTISLTLDSHDAELSALAAPNRRAPLYVAANRGALEKGETVSL